MSGVPTPEEEYTRVFSHLLALGYSVEKLKQTIDWYLSRPGTNADHQVGSLCRYRFIKLYLTDILDRVKDKDRAQTLAVSDLWEWIRTLDYGVEVRPLWESVDGFLDDLACYGHPFAMRLRKHYRFSTLSLGQLETLISIARENDIPINPCVVEIPERFETWRQA